MKSNSIQAMESFDKVYLNLDQELYGESHTDPFLQDEEKLPINELITRILFERKSFLNITEDSLKEEIETYKNGIADEEEEDSKEIEQDLNDQDDNPQESKLQIFQRQKLELASHIGSALNETSLSLDFVSLLISAVKPNVGKATMSPHLNKNIPLGSLTSDRLTPADTDEDEHNNNNNNNKIGYGWKYQALNGVTNLFRSASTGLNEQILKERQYWNMINNVLDNEEILIKMRDPINGSKAIGVKYGYGDSGSSYHDQGLAILRKDEQTGSISFNPISGNNSKLTKSNDKTYKYIRVKILSKFDDDYMLTGQSTFENSLINQSSSHKIVNDIKKARFFLFEEDLFYHLTREAKSLINYNVSIISNKILIEINNQIIEIESVIYDENNEDELNNLYQNINDTSSINNTKAQSILTFLKLMLCCYYNYNLNLKQKVPTSLTKWKQSNTHPLILRPLLGHIKHQVNLTNMSDLLESSLNKFDNEKLKFNIELSKYSNIEKPKTLRDAFQKSINKPFSVFNVKIQNLINKEYLKIEIQVTSTEVFANFVCNLNIIKFMNDESLKNNKQGINVLQMTITDLQDIEECLNWTILNFLK